MVTLSLAGYGAAIQIYDSRNSQVYRAQRIVDGCPVVLKRLKAEYPTPDQLRRYRQEFHLAHHLSLPNVIKAYDLAESQRSPVIVFEDFGGVSLRQWLRAYPQGLPIGLFLPIALQITEAVAQLHSQNVIHKDINPANLVLNPETMVLKAIDLGLSTQLSQETPQLQSPHALEGTLPYLSPEQTGRMNRQLDYRTDFYSLGVTFYEALTGRLPFASDDPLEWVYCHIAKEPIALLARGEPVPPPLAAMVARLMAKNAEDRYQSAWGLKADLEQCWQQWQQANQITAFPLGQQDLSDRLHIPETLYGREREMATLLGAFERIAPLRPEVATASNAAAVLVTGYSGIGKSALVRSLYQPITARRGYFIAGKFDQFQRHIPYSALVAAFTELVKQLLGESAAGLHHWRSQLLNALGDNGQVVIDVIPELELIIGPQPPVPEVSISAAQNRFNLVFQRFTQSFCQPDHPLVMFLDDMQWADSATLNCLEQLLGEGQLNHLLLILAYRDNEVSAGHPLALAIAQLQQRGVPFESIHLSPLSPEAVAQLVAATVHQDLATVAPLAQLIGRKTQGNPFFTNQFLKLLYREQLLTFEHQLGQWRWTLADIEAIGFTDNVVDLMVLQLQKLPLSVQQVLAIAAYVGHSFDLTTLSLIRHQAADTIFADLTIALDLGYVMPRSCLDENLLIQDYQFAHDRIQQAAYTLIPDHQQPATHYRIGQLLKQKLAAAHLDERLFEVVGHLNQSRSLITGSAERIELAQLNLRAAQKARAATAYQVGRQYADVGMALLGAETWTRHYATGLALYELAAELASLCGDVAAMETLADVIMAQAGSALDRVAICRIRMLSKIYRHEPLDAIAIALGFLPEFGITFPEQPSETAIEQALDEVFQLMGHRPIAGLVDLPIMTDPHAIAIVQIIDTIMGAAHIANPALLALLTALSVKLAIQYGNSENSAFAYTYFSMIVCDRLGDVDQGIQFGQLAMDLVDKLRANAKKTEVLCLMGFSILHRKFHIKETLPLQQTGYRSAIEFGNLEFVGYAAHNYCFNAFWCGQGLLALAQAAQNYSGELVQLGQLTTATYCQLHWQMTENLQGHTRGATQLSGLAWQEEIALPTLTAAHDLLGLYIFRLYKLTLAYLFGEFDAAHAEAMQAQAYLMVAAGTVGEPAFYFYDSLIVLARIRSQPDDISTALAQVEQNQSHLRRWADNAPVNYQHKVDLVEAEKCRVLQLNAEAIEHYDRAIAGANTHGFLQEEALAHELAAQFYLGWDKPRIARAYLTEARYGYLCWGALAKVQQLDRQYLDLLLPPQTEASLSNPVITTISSETGKDALDLTTLIKTSEAIASEIVLDRLLQALMAILLENAGAQTGCLLLPEATPSDRDCAFSLAIHSDGRPTPVALSPLDPQTLPHAVLNYVARTHDNVVLNDARQSSHFAQDPYIQSEQPLSVLCYPLLHQGNLVGVVYLENKLTTAAFTPSHIQFLQLLGGQAAIAITNAQLYAQVRGNEQQLQQFLEAVPVGIGVLDRHGHPFYTNQRAQELLGQGTRPDASAAEIADVYRSYLAGTQVPYPNDQLPIVRALKGEASHVDDLDIQQGDRTVPLEAWGMPIYNEVGEVQYAISTFQDITERKQAERILADYSRQLEQDVQHRTAELAQANQQLQAEIYERQLAEQKLQVANQALQRLATLDGLTQVANRRAFDQALQHNWQRLQREQQPLSLILFDVDYFKRYNDCYGHQAGDDCLVQIARAAQQAANRVDDLVARYGGEEFAVILPNTSQAGAIAVAERIQANLRQQAIPHGQSEVSPIVSISLGIASLVPNTASSPQRLLELADQALYAAKHQGRDRFMTALNFPLSA